MTTHDWWNKEDYRTPAGLKEFRGLKDHRVLVEYKELVEMLGG